MSDALTPNPPHEPKPAAADSLAPPPFPPNLDSDITDEITDHISLAARDLQLAGHAADEAHKLAQQNFGDVAAIRRRLWWIQKGDEVMLRIAFAAALVILVIVVAAIGVGGWQMNQTINELGATLATMNETQRALLESRAKEDRPLAIRGRLYLGDKSRPASYASVEVYSLPEGKKVDTLMADDEGRFGTSSLAAGHYTILASLVPKLRDGKPPQRAPDFFAVQSQPVSVYPWSKQTTVELDVAMVDYGQVSVELAKPFPRSIRLTHDKKEITIIPSLVIAIPSNTKQIPIQRLGAETVDWPIVGVEEGLREAEHEEIGRRDRDLDLSLPPPEISNGKELNQSSLPGGQIVVYRRVLPYKRSRRSDAFRAGSYDVKAYVFCRYAGEESGSIHSDATPLGIDTSQLPEQSQSTIEVVDGRRTHLWVTVPDDLERILHEEITQAINDKDKVKLMAAQEKARPVKLELVGQQDMIEPEKLR